MKKAGMRLSLVMYDLILFFAVDILLYVFYLPSSVMSYTGILYQTILSLALIFASRIAGGIYHQVWRYGGIQSYIRLLLTDGVAFCVYYLIQKVIPYCQIPFIDILAFCSLNLLGALAMRMMYRYAYKCGGQDNRRGKVLRWILRVFSAGRVHTEADPDSQKIKVAIIGAGAVGVSLAEDLINNPKSQYRPRCFVDTSADKAGRSIHDLPVLAANELTVKALKDHQIQEVFFAVPNMDTARKYELFKFYQDANFRVKVYDYESVYAKGQKRHLREFDIEDLLMRKQKDILDDKTKSYYKGKTVLITGGGGSIGSELCRQLAKMQPKQIIILDIYENCAYDVQQEIKFNSKNTVDVRVEIVSITNKKGLGRVFEEYHPDICINAAAHKHVPLMEKNCIEAVENNIFGTFNVISSCEEYGCGRFMMVSTDKAVNPTNVMGATKRFCEMIMQAFSTRGNVKCSATRFGNVLGSAGSVIPIFKRQLQTGGPLTVTDKRIIRYFMTIPEASQLVLTSGAMAENGELFVLDMGKPVSIYELAQKMISLSGMTDVQIVETGLRPGEKLYEELLVNNDLEKTDNDQIFIDRETPVTFDMLMEKMSLLRNACASNDDAGVKLALRKVVPTFRTPEEVNAEAVRKMNA